MKRRAVAFAAVVCVVSVSSLTGCSTTYDTTLASEQAVTSTSSTLPTGSPDELLARLVREATGLSTLMMADQDAASSAQRIGELWDAVKGQVDAKRPDLSSDFSSNVARCATAVRFSRAADADKAAKNLVALVEAYVGA